MHGWIGGGNEIMGWDLRVCGWRREWLPLVAGLRAGLAQFDEACMKKFEGSFECDVTVTPKEKGIVLSGSILDSSEWKTFSHNIDLELTGMCQTAPLSTEQICYASFVCYKPSTPFLIRRSVPVLLFPPSLFSKSKSPPSKEASMKGNLQIRIQRHEPHLKNRSIKLGSRFLKTGGV
jgi:hypothetical protein